MKINAFLQDTRGNIAITMAMCLVPLMMIAGGSLDYVSTTHDKEKLQTLVFQAANTASRLIKTASNSEVESHLLQFVTLASDYNVTPSDLKYEISQDRKAISVKMNASHKNAFLASFGMNEFNYSVEALALAPIQKGPRPTQEKGELTIVLGERNEVGARKIEMEELIKELREMKEQARQ
jgi:hypothetical protein